MSSDGLLSASDETFGKIIKGDSSYLIPMYQRDYSWEEDHWEDLWNDIIANRTVQSKHYMGSVVLIPKDKKQFEVIDGQQRLTTLTIVILAAISIIKDLIDEDVDVEQNTQRVDLLIADYIGKKSLSSLTTKNKIRLNENNNPYFSTYLLQFRNAPNPRSQLKSNKQLLSCFNFFKEKLKFDIYQNENIDGLIDFVEYTSDNLLFIKITATDDLSAFLIFETLNDRGLALSVTDLLKNFIFSIVDEDDREHIKNKWNEILSQISYQSFPRFLRHFWMIKHGHIQEKDLFKTIKREVKTATEVFNLMNELEELSGVYAALNNPGHELWINNRANISHVKELDLFKVTQCYPLLMSAYQKFTDEEFTKVLRICTVISFRYLTIAGQNPNAMEKIYCEIAQLVSFGNITKAAHVFERIKGLYINDDDFIGYFEDKSIKTKRSSKLARYILFKIESHLTGKFYDFENDPGTLEHILPENPTGNWDIQFPQDVQDNFIYRIGNFTILEASINRKIGNAQFDDKREAYKNSKYHLSNSCQFKEWSEDNLRARQRTLARYAKAVWSLTY